MKEYFKFTPMVRKASLRINFSSPKGYYFPSWLFDFKKYGELTWYLRICGVMIQKVWKNVEV